jgi:IS5 family transposase
MKSFLDEHGKLMHGGTIVDATIIDAPSSTKNEEKQRDPEMHQVKKGTQWYFGARLHAGVDAGTGYVHSIEVTAANVNERDIVPALVREDDEVVYGDAGYTGIEKRDEIKNDPHLSTIDYRLNSRKPYRKNEWKPGPGIQWFRTMEYHKSRVRCKVEYAFFHPPANFRLSKSTIPRYREKQNTGVHVVRERKPLHAGSIRLVQGFRALQMTRILSTIQNSSVESFMPSYFWFSNTILISVYLTSILPKTDNSCKYLYK